MVMARPKFYDPAEVLSKLYSVYWTAILHLEMFAQDDCSNERILCLAYSEIDIGFFRLLLQQAGKQHPRR